MMEKKSFSDNGKLWFSIIASSLTIIFILFDPENDKIGALIWDAVGEAGAYVVVLCIIPVWIIGIFIFGMVTGSKNVTKPDTKKLGYVAVTLSILMFLFALAWYDILNFYGLCLSFFNNFGFFPPLIC